MSAAPPAPRDKSSAATFACKQSHIDGGGRCTHNVMERDRIGLWGIGDGQSTSRISGLDRLKHPGLNKVSRQSLTDRWPPPIWLGHGCTEVYEYYELYHPRNSLPGLVTCEVSVAGARCLTSPHRFVLNFTLRVKVHTASSSVLLSTNFCFQLIRITSITWIVLLVVLYFCEYG